MGRCRTAVLCRPALASPRPLAFWGWKPPSAPAAPSAPTWIPSSWPCRETLHGSAGRPSSYRVYPGTAETVCADSADLLGPRLLDAFQPSRQKVHLGDLVLQLCRAGVAVALHLGRAGGLATGDERAHALQPRPALLLQKLDQPHEDHVGLLQRGGLPGLELGARGLRELVDDGVELAPDEAVKLRDLAFEVAIA